MENTEETEQEQAVSFSEIFRRIWKRKWIVLGASVAVTLVAALLFAFVLNPLFASYTLAFDIVYPASEEQKYPDGSPFYYQDIVSAEYLSKAQESDAERFGDIDIGKMVEKNDATIEAEIEEINGVRTYTGKYFLKIKVSYFKSEQIGNDFVKAVASVPEILVKEKAASIDYTLGDALFTDSSFQSRLSLLASQKEAIIAQYDAWIEVRGGSYRVDGKTLLSYRASAETLFDRKTQDSLIKDLEQGGYVPVEEIADERKSLKEEYDINLKKIEELKKAMISTVSLAADMPVAVAAQSADESGPTIVFPEADPDLSQMLASLIARNENIRHQLGEELNAEDLTKGALTQKNVEAYARRVDTQYLALKEEAEKLQQVSASLYNTEADTRFETEKVEEDGDTSLILVVVVAFVVALIVACVIVYAADVAKEKKRAALPPQESDPPAPEQE